MKIRNKTSQGVKNCTRAIYRDSSFLHSKTGVKNLCRNETDSAFTLEELCNNNKVLEKYKAKHL